TFRERKMDIHSKIAREITEVKANLEYMEDLAAISDDPVEALSAELAVESYQEDLRELMNTWNVITR
ncbi:hypothetical protein LCGC14_1687970, partial [marine sediment metagenome]